MCFAYFSKNVRCRREGNVDIWNPKIENKFIETKDNVLVEKPKVIPGNGDGKRKQMKGLKKKV